VPQPFADDLRRDSTLEESGRETVPQVVPSAAGHAGGFLPGPIYLSDEVMSPTQSTATVNNNGTAKATFYADGANKPAVLLPHIEGIPAELKDRPQWVCWRLEWKKARRKWDKPPINPRNGAYASHSDLTTWSSFADALAYYRSGKCEGLGFVFCTADPYCGIDLDDCRDRQTGQVAQWARAIVAELDSYCEISPSGTGLKIIVRAKLPGPGRRVPLGTGEVELYDQLRYFTVTGIPWRPE